MKTLNEQIDRIKSVMGLITEQDDTYANFISQGFFNCRGIKLRIHGDDSYGGGGGGSQKQISNWEDLTTKTDFTPSYKDFKKQNPELIKKIDERYFNALFRDSDRMKTKNDNKINYVASTNENMFLSDEKTFNGAMKDGTAYAIDQILRSGDGFYFYWRNLFGSKNPTIMDIYNHIESIGGKSAYEKLADSGYNANQTRINMMNEIAKNELQKQKK